MLLVDQIETPIGTVHLAVRDTYVCGLRFDTPFEGHPYATPLSDQVRAYFDGYLDALDVVEVAPEGTPFQKDVWRELRRIPVGETRSYGELAEKLGSSARAIGSANRTNPIALIIPCHRVIAADGTLCGYASGLDRKRWLLNHEKVTSVQGRLALQ